MRWVELFKPDIDFFWRPDNLMHTTRQWNVIKLYCSSKYSTQHRTARYYQSTLLLHISFLQLIALHCKYCIPILPRGGMYCIGKYICRGPRDFPKGAKSPPSGNLRGGCISQCIPSRGSLHCTYILSVGNYWFYGVIFWRTSLTVHWPFWCVFDIRPRWCDNVIPGDHIIRYRPSEYQEKHPYSATHVGIVEINISLIITASEMYIAPRISSLLVV